jgi:monoamine oxidase
VDYGEGLSAEYGMQEIWGNNPLVNIARELGVGLTVEYLHGAHSTFMHDGHIYPDVYDGTMRGHWESFLTPRACDDLEGWLRAARDLHGRARALGVADPEVRMLQEISYQEWIESSQLSSMARVWLRLHMEAELGSDWSRFSALYALLELEIFFDGGASYHIVEGGSSRLIEALARRSGPISTSARVVAVDRRSDADGRPRVEVSYLRDNRVRSIQAGRVVVAIPFFRIHELHMDPPLSDLQRQALHSLGMGQYVVVHLLMNKRGATLTTGDGIDLPDGVLSSGPLGYVYGVVDENERHAVFSLLVFGRHARAFHMAPQEERIQELLDALDRIEPGFSRHVFASYVYRYHPAAVAVWGPGRSPLDELSAALRRPSRGLYLVGDYLWGGHSNSAVVSALDAAKHIAAELAGP